MVHRNRLTHLADDQEVDAQTVERDYVLTHVLVGISRQAGCERMVLKGGTALRACFFEDYRYSADLTEGGYRVPGTGDAQPDDDSSQSSMCHHMFNEMGMYNDSVGAVQIPIWTNYALHDFVSDPKARSGFYNDFHLGTPGSPAHPGSARIIAGSWPNWRTS